MNQEDQLRRGNRAAVLLDDELIKEAFEVIEGECIKQWRAAPARDTEGREHIWMMLKLTDRLKAHLESVLNTGKITDKQIALLEKESKISRIFK